MCKSTWPSLSTTYPPLDSHPAKNNQSENSTHHRHWQAHSARSCPEKAPDSIYSTVLLVVPCPQLSIHEVLHTPSDPPADRIKNKSSTYKKCQSM